MGEELEDEGVVLAMVDLVPDAQEDSKGHVENSKDQGDFHLVTIEERYAV